MIPNVMLSRLWSARDEFKQQSRLFTSFSEVARFPFAAFFEKLRQIVLNIFTPPKKLFQILLMSLRNAPQRPDEKNQKMKCIKIVVPTNPK